MDNIMDNIKDNIMDNIMDNITMNNVYTTSLDVDVNVDVNKCTTGKILENLTTNGKPFSYTTITKNENTTITNLEMMELDLEMMEFVLGLDSLLHL